MRVVSPRGSFSSWENSTTYDAAPATGGHARSGGFWATMAPREGLRGITSLFSRAGLMACGTHLSSGVMTMWSYHASHTPRPYRAISRRHSLSAHVLGVRTRTETRCQPSPRYGGRKWNVRAASGPAFSIR